MGVKREDGTLDDPCLDNVRPGEPFFVLRSQDQTAPPRVLDWIQDNKDRLSTERLREAHMVYINMIGWQKDHPELVKLPD